MSTLTFQLIVKVMLYAPRAIAVVALFFPIQTFGAESTTKLLYDGELSGVKISKVENATEISDPFHVATGDYALKLLPDQWHKPMFWLPSRTNFNDYETLEFFYKSSQDNQSHTLKLIDYGTLIGQTVSIEKYIEGGTITTSYKKVSIPLADLKSPAFDLSTVYTFIFGTNSQNSQFYIDDVKLRVTNGAQVLGIETESAKILKLSFSSLFDTSSATTLGNYQILSPDDSNYVSAKAPVAAGYSSRGTGFTQENANSIIMAHQVYLELPQPMIPGKTYTVKGAGLIDKFGLAIPFAQEGLSITYSENLVNPHIKVNQVGYFPASEKVGILGGWVGTLGPMNIDASHFTVIEAQSGTTVLTGVPELKALNEKFSGENVYYLNFSALQQPGSYHLNVPGFGRSYTFQIGEDIYQSVYLKTARALYHQRCGTSMDVKHVHDAKYARPACHVESDAFFHDNLQDAEAASLYRGEVIGAYNEAWGGWHDAGDYNKYVTNASAPVQRIITAFELYPEKFKDADLNIPESGNGVPDILDELKWELDWLLKMQDPVDGGVYFKISAANFGLDSNLPHLLTNQRYYVYKTTHSTAAFAAMMAGASRVYLSYFPESANLYLMAAQKAWAFLQAHPETVPADSKFNPSGIYTGPYPDKFGDKDERAWAAAELFKTTGQSVYQAAYLALRNTQDLPLSLMGYDAALGNFFDAHPFATWAYATANHAATDPTAKQAAKQAFLQFADRRIANFESFPYRASLQAVEAYVGFGSYGVSTKYSFQLLQAYYLSGNTQYKDYALKNLDTQLGLNPLNKSFITGVGANPAISPLQKPSIYLSLPTPGIPVFGPQYHASEGNPFNAAIQQKSLPPNDEWPVLRRYADTYLVVEYSEFTIDEIATTAMVYAKFIGNSVIDRTAPIPPKNLKITITEN